MTNDDFNMYFSNSYVLNKRGKLCYIGGSSGREVAYSEYLDKEHTAPRTVSLRDVEKELVLKPFKLKPFSYHGVVYSPSFKAIRGYKDGVNVSRLDLTEVGSTQNNRTSVDTVPAMFFEPVFSFKEGVSRIVTGESSYSSVEDDFLLIKKVDKENKDPEPFQNVNGYQNDDGVICIEDTATQKEYVLASNIRLVNIKKEAPSKLISLVCRLAVHTGWPSGKIPATMQNDYLGWVQRNSKKEVPRIELYRAGCLIGDILEEPDDMFANLPRLSKVIKELKDEYIHQTSRS